MTVIAPFKLRSAEPAHASRRAISTHHRAGEEPPAWSRARSGNVPSVLVFAGGGTSHVSGGVGTLLVYLAASWGNTALAPRMSVVDTRGSKGALGAAAMFTMAVLRLFWAAIVGNASIVHVHMTTRGSVWRKCILCLIARICGVPTVIHQHGADFIAYYQGQPGPVRWMIRRTLNAAGRIVVLGESWKTFLVQDVRVPSEKIAIIMNGVPRPPQVVGGPSGRAVKTAHIVFLGRLGDRKGVPELVAALASPAMRSRAWRATLAGDGDRARFQKLAADAGIADRIAFPGWQDRPAKEALLREADLLVLPSHHEAMPLAVLEGLAHGVSVVTTPVGVVPEFLEDGVNALLVPPGSVSDLARAMASLVDDPQRRDALSRAGHELFLQRLDIDVVAEKMAAVYQDVLSTRSMEGRAA